MSIDSTVSVNIRPGVSILSVLRHLNYKPWYALAEFVDNALQSFLTYRMVLALADTSASKLRVDIAVDLSDTGRITVRDNAAGIHYDEFPRAFRPAEVPPDQGGLSEFGMGMKSAACWFAKRWSVRTCALGEGVERTVSFDIDEIVRTGRENLDVHEATAPLTAHYTEIELLDLHKPPYGRTIGKMREHLASIYRIFIREGVLDLRFDGEDLQYEEPKVLYAPFYKDPAGTPQKEWLKSIDIDLGAGMRARGFAALRETGSTSLAGFALFRRGRLIEGSADEAYRPAAIFGRSNSFTYQRLFGELNLEGFEVSHTKDGFRWGESEDYFLERLKQQLDAKPLPLLMQAEGFRSRPRSEDLKAAAETAVTTTAEVIRREVPPILEEIRVLPPVAAPPADLAPAEFATRRVIDVQLGGKPWQIVLELTRDPAVGSWVELFDTSAGASPDEALRRVGVRLSQVHPFTRLFAGPSEEGLEPMLRMAAALGLAVTAARDSGVKETGTILRNVNALLRDALAKP